ncbi:MAG: hypothetical protein EOP71_05090 [Variovorax sp.]|jgi:hypothetical protein|nr:MAG: hypothetical protein EOP71_05090 [Variovorax sp.]
MKTEVTLQLGLSGPDFAIALGREDARVSRQPAGLNFYEIHWPDQTSGIARFEHGANGFELTTVLGVMGTEDVDRPSAGVYEILISFGLPPRNEIPHDEARLQVMALLKRLQDAGWQQSYHFSEARVKGRSTLRHPNSMDIRYTPNFKEWMGFSIETVRWKLRANGVYMSIAMNRDGDRMDSHRPGAYFLSMTLETEEQYMRGHFGEKDRDNWKALWPEFSKVLNESRAEDEAKARLKGLEIDTAYKDPPILALKVPVVSLSVGQPCSRSGVWQASLPPDHPAAFLLARAPQRLQRVEAGEPMPAVYSRLMYPPADADNAAITWVLVRAV